MRYKIRNFTNLSLHPDFRWDGEYLCFEPYKSKSLKYVPIGNTLHSSPQNHPCSDERQTEQHWAASLADN